MKNIAFTFLLFSLHLNALAQIGIGTTTPNASSILDLTATDKGLLVPRMTQAQRLAISSPAKGLLVYQNDGADGFYYWNGSAWTQISTSSGDNLGNHIATQNIQLNGNWLSGNGGNEGVYVDNSGYVGIGTSSPSYPLQVNGSARFDFDATINGKLGIGTTTPTDELHVVGSARITSLSNGLVKSDASGVLSTIAYTSASDVLRGDGTFGTVPIGNLAWSTTGNTGLTSGTHFLGTMDNVPLRFKVNNTNAGIIDPGNTSTYFGFGTGTGGTDNTGIGTYALKSGAGFFQTALGSHALSSSSLSGTSNTAIGAYALSSNTEGNSNTAVGNLASNFNTKGSNNAAVGVEALKSNTTANNNVAIGNEALYTQSFSNGGTPWNSDNVAVGYQALFYNQPTSTTNGIQNTAIGNYALYSNTTGNFNTAIGINALNDNTTGISNTAIGKGTLSYNTTGNRNTAIGVHALNDNTTGNYNTAIGLFTLATNKAGSNGTAVGCEAMVYANNTATPFTNTNSAFGYQALRGSINPAANTGLGNTAIGYQTLLNNTSGSDNTTNGVQALYSNTTGNLNTAIGKASMYYNQTGGSNVAIGANALEQNQSGNYATAVGVEAMKNFKAGGNTFNTGLGYWALRGSTIPSSNTGTMNTAIGATALYQITSGTDNVAVGYNSLSNITTGSRNIAIGSNSGPGVAGSSYNNTIAIGTQVVPASNNVAVIGSATYPVNLGLGTNQPIFKLDVRSNNSKSYNTYHDVFHVGSNDGSSSMGLFVGWQGGGAKYVRIHAFDSPTTDIPISIQPNFNSNAKILFGTISFAGPASNRKFHFGSGANYNPSIVMNGSSLHGAYGIEFYEAGAFRSSIGYSPVGGQEWFFIYDGAGNILRSKNGYTAIGEVGTAQFHSTLETTGSFAAPVTTINANTTLDHTHFIVYRTGGNITLPAANTCRNRMYIIVNRNNFNANISSYTDLNGTSSTTILPNTSITIVSNGTNWLRVQ